MDRFLQSSLGSVLVMVIVGAACSAALAESGADALIPPEQSRLQLGGPLGARVEANTNAWLIEAPAANPGLVGMFQMRDRDPTPEMMPWAGEFAGKYLISGVQALRLSDDPALRETLDGVVDRLLAAQAEDGYLGPWPEDQRLLGQWDLWGHYHLMLGLMMWTEHTGEPEALQAARQAADLVCETYLDTDRRVLDAGASEMNMAIVHVLARLYRETGTERYLDLAQQIVREFEQAGDYLHTGLEGVPFYRTPKPRWESLHSLQGLAELHRITGDPTYRQAFLHHWASMRKFDQRNTGGFSSAERATGNPYTDTPIETCCSVAWMALMIDALRFTGDPTIADDLELATFNAIAGAQHPSGRWWTYDTPMRGRRVASHDDIDFQSRAGTPELNCCSVNGSRGLGMLADWAVMRSEAGLTVNYYGPLETELSLANGTTVALTQQTDYPVASGVDIAVDPERAHGFELALRIPNWSERTQVLVNGEPIDEEAEPGRYLRLEREWDPGDRVRVELDLSLRYVAGDREQYRRASLYRGPVLLALDTRFNAHDFESVPAMTPGALAEAETVDTETLEADAGWHRPWLVVDVPVGDETLRLCDFASAGSMGTSYRTWLPAERLRPPRPVPSSPWDGTTVPGGEIEFHWRDPADDAASERQHVVVIAENPGFATPAVRSEPAAGDRFVLSAEQAEALEPHRDYYWKIVAVNDHGRQSSRPPHQRFRIDPDLPPEEADPAPYGERPEDKALLVAPLRGELDPVYGSASQSEGVQPARGPDGGQNGAIRVDGEPGHMARFELERFPQTDYAVSLWIAVDQIPETRLGQVFSAWHDVADDPLRICFEDGLLSARIEDGGIFATDGIEVEAGQWMHVAAVKDDDRLTLYVDGEARASAAVPPHVVSQTRQCALGGNPNFTGGNESVAGRFAELRLYARALEDEEIAELHEAGPDAMP